VLAADLNGDGKTDLAALGSTPTPPLTILLGNGAGGFSIAATPAVGSSAGQIKFGRFNADNIVDLVLLHTNGFIDLIYGSSAGDFTPVNGGSFQDGPAGVEVIDLNHDNLDDLAVALKDTTGPITHGFQPFTNTGAGFNAGTRIDLPGAREPFGIAVGDFNADGNADAAIALAGGILSVFRGSGNGVFQSPQYWVLPNTGGGLLAADVNLDSRKDLIYLENSGTSTIVPILNLNNQGFKTSRAVVYGGTDVVPADLTGDSLLDLVTGTDTVSGAPSEVVVTPNDGNHGFLSAANFATSGDFRALDAADFNGDGKMDIVTAHASGTNQIAVRLGDGAGALGPPIVTNWAGSVVNVLAGRFNADSLTDVLLVEVGQIRVLAGLGNGNFNTTPLQSITSDPNFRPQIADVNHDGKPDIIAFFFGTLTCYLGNGNGTFTVSDARSINLRNFVMGDVNGDGNPDIVVLRNPSGTAVVRYFGNGAGQFNATDDLTIPSQASGLIAADFNNDGFVDIALSLQNNITILVVVPSNAQTTGWVQPLLYSVGSLGSQIMGLAAGDYDHDGKVDIAFTNSGASGVIYNKTGTSPCMSINDVTITEGDTGALNANFAVSLTAPSLDPVLVNYSLTPGTAASGVDYQNVSGRLLIPAGQPSGTVAVPILGDLSDEFDETFTVTLSGTTNATLDDAVGAGTILDNDAEPTLTISNATKTENGASSSMIFQVNLSVASGKPITFQYATADGSATANLDYAPTSGTGTIPPGTATSGVSVTITDDQMFEPDETLFVNLTNPTNVVLGTTQAQGTITNDDPIPTLEIVEGGFDEGDVGVRNIPAIVVISNPSYLPISLSFSTSNGTAIAGVDYQSSSGSATIQPGATSVQLPMHLIGDTINEPPETFNVTVSNVTNANSGILTAPFTIGDDEFIASDFDNDGRTDLSVFRPSDKTWYVLRSLTNTVTANTFGLATDIPVSGDYNGDGRTDQAVFRPSTGDWYVRNPSLTIHWGQSGDIPAPGDFDNDGLLDEAVFRPADGNWYILLSTGGTKTVHWGQSGDTPVAADYDGDGKTDIAVFRAAESNWYVLRSSDNTVAALHWGSTNDVPLARDYDGDGRADIAVWRPSNGYWYVLRTSDGGVTYFQWGQSGDKPVPGNYDGDAKTDYAVYRDGVWYIYLSSNDSLVIKQFGLAGDTPIPFASSN
jgi:hypothetical protein